MENQYFYWAISFACIGRSIMFPISVLIFILVSFGSNISKYFSFGLWDTNNRRFAHWVPKYSSKDILFILQFRYVLILIQYDFFFRRTFSSADWGHLSHCLAYHCPLTVDWGCGAVERWRAGLEGGKETAAEKWDPRCGPAARGLSDSSCCLLAWGGQAQRDLSWQASQAT